MKNKLPQLIAFISKIDLNTIQLAYFAFAVLGFVLLQAPSDGGTGPR